MDEMQIISVQHVSIFVVFPFFLLFYFSELCVGGIYNNQNDLYTIGHFGRLMLGHYFIYHHIATIQ